MISLRFLKATLWAFLSILVAVVVLLFYVWRLNVVELEYATYEKAVAAGAFKDAALPGFLPKSAKNIKSSRNRDANISRVTFDFGSDFEQFLNLQMAANGSSIASMAEKHGSDFSDPNDLKYFPLISSESGLYHGSLLINQANGKAVYVEPAL